MALQFHMDLWERFSGWLLSKRWPLLRSTGIASESHPSQLQVEGIASEKALE